MKKLIFLILFLTGSAYSQTTFHNASVSIKNGKINFFSNIEGVGKIKIGNSLFKAEKISCGIAVSKDRFSAASYFQSCTIRAFDLTGKYLGTFKSKDELFTKFREIGGRQNTPIILTNRRRFLGKIFILK